MFAFVISMVGREPFSVISMVDIICYLYDPGYSSARCSVICVNMCVGINEIILRTPELEDPDQAYIRVYA